MSTKQTIEDINDNIVSDLEDTIDSSDIENWKSLSKIERGFLIKEILDAQADIISDAFSNKENIKIPKLGQFKIKEGRKKALEVKKRELAKRGYANDGQIIDKEEYQEIKKIMSEEVKSDNIKRRIKSKSQKIGSNITKFNFKKKVTNKSENKC